MVRNKQARPVSKRDKSLPYTYEGRVDILEGGGQAPVYDHYFSDTICGLIEYLAEMELGPQRVRLTGLYRRQEIVLDYALLTDENGNWLKRPALCRALAEHYKHTADECYKGHVVSDRCAFSDRDRQGVGPLW